MFYERLKEFETFERNWNGYDSEPISKVAIKNALHVCLFVLHDAHRELEVFPLASGGIQLEYKDWDLAELTHDGKFIFIGLNNENLDNFDSSYDGEEMWCYDLCEKISKIVKDYE